MPVKSSRDRPSRPRPRGLPPPWGVIADDLTGATDTAAAFARNGFSSVVILDRRLAPPVDADVVLVTTDSRRSEPAGARVRVRRAYRWLMRHRLTLLYKKVDSTMKGNVVAEIAALAASAGPAQVVFCPANPAQGRVVRGGILEIRGKPWGNLPSEFRRGGMSVSVGPPAELSRELSGPRHSARALIADAVRAPSLRALARTTLAKGSRILLAGSAGLAAAMAEELAGRFPRGRAVVGRHRSAGGRRVLLFVGSRNPVTLEQVRHLRESRLVELHSARGVSAGSVSAKCALVPLPIHRGSDDVIVRRLIVWREPFQRGHIGAWLATGGDTALRVCRWLGVRALVVNGEITPGLAWGRVVGGIADGLPFATKPGGFGHRSDLVRAIRFLRQQCGPEIRTPPDAPPG